MSIDIAASLNEHKRNALLSYYLGQYVPHSENENLVSLIQSPEDVYEYLLIDPLVSNAVATSWVAQAISSIQQYINSIVLNMEPGYNTVDLAKEQIRQWNDGANQYDIWAGEVELDTYPENYIDPTLRQSQTTYFKELITDLNQNTINSDTAQQAVMKYLNKFEQVANLEIISGYLDGFDQTKDIYYFLGKTRTSPFQYYWRSFDMSQNINNTISTSAWSEWHPMGATINEDALISRPRLVYFNNRLYVFWYEQQQSGMSSDNASTYHTIRAYSSYSDFNNSWSTPALLGAIEEENNLKEDDTYYSLFPGSPSFSTWSKLSTACLYNQTENSITVSLYNFTSKSDDDLSQGYSDFSFNIDYWFTTTIVHSASPPSSSAITILARYLGNYGGDAEQARIQQAYTNKPFSIDSVDVVDNSFVNDFGGTASLPTLSIDNFELENNTDGSLTLRGYIPSEFDTQPYFGIRVDNAQFYTEPEHEPCHISFTFSANNNFIEKIKVTDILLEFPKYAGSSVTNVGFDATGIKTTTLLDKVYGSSNQSIDFGESIFYIDNLAALEVQNFTVALYESNFASTGSLSFSMKDTVNISNYPKFTWTFTIYDGENSWKESSATKVLDIENRTQFPEPNEPRFDFSITITAIPSESTHYEYISFGYERSDGSSIHEEYKLTLKNLEYITSTPYIIYGNSTSANGSAIYLDYKSDKFADGTSISPIRLNTLFAKELINKASLSIQSLLNWDTQLTLEPPLSSDGSGDPIPMDFSDANGIYFWELFFYMPHLVAYRLNQEQRYADAQSWFNYIFDPSARGRVSSNADYPEPDYWSVRPLVELPASEAQGEAVGLSTDPDALASANPVHYQKAIFMAYIRNLVAAADANYRLLTNDGLSLAKLQYCQAKNLLGPRPDAWIVNQWTPKYLVELTEATYQSEALRQYEHSSLVPTPLFAGNASATMETATNDSFMAPLNTQLLSYWNTLDSRLYNLRHNLSIDGLPMTVPLYAPPLNPTLLMEQSVQGGSLINAANGIVASIPPYRFRTMLQSAKDAAGTLSQLGQTLLSYCERGDSASLQELDQQQLLNISSFTISLQQNAIDALDKDKEALGANLSMAQQRRDHYQTLYNNGISSNEQDVLNKINDAQTTFLSSSALLLTAGGLDMAPNIFGLADGGDVWGAAVKASAETLQVSSQGLMMATQRIQTSEEYRRRSEEWQIQFQQAQSEMDVTNKQLDALAVRRQGAIMALQQVQAQQADLQSTLNFLTTRFTQSSLYTWLTGQLSALYYQAYDAVLSLCLSTEACWQYEMGDITTRFIQTSAWNNSYRGLLVGETLQLNLHQMESAWLNRNTRRLELTKTLSLKQLINGETAWNAFTNSGTVNFSLNEKLFDHDYPGHYLRQIKSVTVSLPALIGPYQDVRMTLTQSGSSVLLKADINGVNYLNDNTKGSSQYILNNPRASQQVAMSSGLNDAGVFELNFGDERYLPFEGTGAVSSWQIAFPNPSSNEQKALLASLNDVIIQVHYTALYGGTSFEQAVTETLK